jgi:hypothetical protein
MLYSHNHIALNPYNTVFAYFHILRLYLIKEINNSLKIKGEKIMKMIILYLTAFTILNAQTKIHISNLELTYHQVIGLEKINNKLYIASYGGGGGPAAIDVYDTEKHSIVHDIFKDSEVKITFGNTNMFKDTKNNLWIGDINSLYKIDIEGRIVNLYENVEVPDSTYFEIRSITEDENGNIFFIKRNTKTHFSGKQNGTNYSWATSTMEIIKYNGNSLEQLQFFESNGPAFEKIYYFNNKLYFSMLNFEMEMKHPGVFTLDLQTNKVKSLNFKLPTVEDINELSWESVRLVQLRSMFQLNNQLYFFVNVEAKSNHFQCFMKYDEVNSKFEYFSMRREERLDGVLGLTSYCVYNNRIFCQRGALIGQKKEFYEFKDDEFVLVEFETELIPEAITHQARHNDINKMEDYKKSAGFSISGKSFINEKGELFSGTIYGLLILKNFLQDVSSVENNEVNLKTIPELTNVKNELFIESEIVINSYKVFDINSKMIQTQSNLNSNNINLNFEGLTVGIYFIELETQHGSKLLKFIKN